MHFARGLSAVALIGAISGCVATSTDTAVSTQVMEAACIAAVEMHTNNHDIVVLSSDPLGSSRDFTLQVGGTGIWTCVVSPGGTVTSIDVLSSDGSTLA